MFAVVFDALVAVVLVVIVELLFGVGDFCLETTIIIKTYSHPFYPINFD